MKFEIKFDYKPTRDQPQAIEKLVSSIDRNEQYQTLLGIMSSYKTLKLNNAIKNIYRQSQPKLTRTR